MSGIKLSTLLTLSLLLAGPAWAKVEACGKRVQVYNEYEELDKDGKIVTKVSIFNPTNWSNDGGFEGVLVKKDQLPKQDTVAKVEIEVRKGKGKPVKKDWAVKSWDGRDDYLAAKDFKAADVFGDRHDADGTYTLRLLLDGKAACEETRKIEKSHD